jgi:hypothetical protein
MSHDNHFFALQTGPVGVSVRGCHKSSHGAIVAGSGDFGKPEYLPAAIPAHIGLFMPGSVG